MWKQRVLQSEKALAETRSKAHVDCGGRRQGMADGVAVHGKWAGTGYKGMARYPLAEMTCSNPRRPVHSHFMVCSENYLFIVGIGPIRDKGL